MVLEVKCLTKSFGGVMAVHDTSFHVNNGEIFALIGPNGAGKTTVFNLISGMLQPDKGEIEFKGKSILGLEPYRIRQMGIARTFQNLQLFSSLSALENVMVGAYLKGRKGFIQSLLHLPGVSTEEKKIRQQSLDCLEELGLADEVNTLASVLPFGKQRLLEIARAICGSPELILLDEPAAGLNASETEQLAQYLKKLSKKGFSLILVEHDMNMVMEIADRILVLNFGTPISQGTPEEIQNNKLVRKAYLGEEEEFFYASSARS